MKSAGKARNNGLYRHIRTSKEIIRNLLNDCKNSSSAAKAADVFYAVIFFFIWLIAFFSRRDTCACDMPTAFATSICVRPS